MVLSVDKHLHSTKMWDILKVFIFMIEAHKYAFWTDQLTLTKHHQMFSSRAFTLASGTSSEQNNDKLFFYFINRTQVAGGKTTAACGGSKT